MLSAISQETGILERKNQAAALIHKHHYGRRFAELADAEEATKRG